MFIKLREHSFKNNVPIISKYTQNLIVSVLNKYKPICCVEIWTAIGYSSLVIANSIQKFNGILTTFEVSHPSYYEALNNFISYNQINNILAYNIDPLSIDISLIFNKKKVDFLFIDAQKRTYLDFYLKFKSFLSSKSIIIFDNMIKFQSKTASLYKFFEKNQINYKLFEFGDDWVVVVKQDL